VLTGLLLAVVIVGGPPVPIWGHFLDHAQVLCGEKASSLLMLLDLDADGSDEILLAHSSHCGSGGCPWLVYTPTDVTGNVQYAGSVGFGLVAFSQASRVLLGSWHMSASDSVQTCWRLEQRELLVLPAEECSRVPWAPAHLTGEDRYRWIRAHEPLRLAARDECGDAPESQDWVEAYRRPFNPQRIPNLRRMYVVNPERQ
jgi:hypothetical protein